MNNPFKIDVRTIRRVAYAMLATLLMVAGIPFFGSGKALAANQLSNRSIQITDSGPSGGSITSGVGSGTNVTYRVSFTTFTAAQSLVIDFCSQDPIIGDTCTGPTGMDASTAAIASVTSGGNITSAGWSITPSTSQVKLAKASGSATSIGAQQFDLTGIKNPSTTGTFYARIYTFVNTGFTDGTTAYSSATSPGGYADYGGIALSTAAVIQVTARVQEQLTFCVSKLDPASWSAGTPFDCSSSDVTSNPPTVTLGVAVGAGQPVLDPSRVDTGDVYSQVSTNATHGAVVDMRNSNTSCGGLSADNGTTCAIPANNGGSATPSAITAGTAAFGMCEDAETTVTGDTSIVGSITPASAYHDGTHNIASPPCFYGMDTATSPSNGGSPATNIGNVDSTFGSTVGTTATPVHHADSHYRFAATPSLTTPAGIYTANLTMIATGTF